MIRRLAALSSLALLLAAPAALAAPPGFAFLEVPTGARASGMGGAYLAVADGIEAAWWNPAALAGIQGTQLTASHFEYFENLRHEQFAIGSRHFGGGLAASVRAMYSEPIEERDEIGNLIGTFGSHDLELQLAYGHRSAGGIGFGLGAQMIRERIASETAMTWGGSIGMDVRPARVPDLRASLAVQHAGPSAHYDIDGQQGRPVNLPLAVHGGVAWHRGLGNGLGLTPALDVRATRGRQAVVALGAELDSDTGAALRLGLRQGDDIASGSAGLGWRWRAYRVDYAWVPSKLDLGDTHRFSFAAQF